MMKSASQPVGILLLSFVKSTLDHGTPVLSQRPNFLIPTLQFVARTDNKSFCWIEGCHFCRKEHELFLRSVYGMKGESMFFLSVGMLTSVSKNSAVI